MSHLPSLARFVILYTALYSAFGVISPFLPAIFQDRGLSAEDIAVVVGSGTAVRLVAGPLVGRLADRHRAWRGSLSICAAGAGVTALGYAAARGFGPVLLVSLLQSVLLAPLAPVADAVAVSASRPNVAHGFEYGWVRAAGSAAFVAGSLAAGELAAVRGLVVSIWLNAVLLGAAAFAAMPVPNISVDRGISRPPAAGLLVLLQVRPFRRLLLAAALVLGSHALHDTFAVIRWRAAGIGTATASLLWSESVVAEVFVFLVAGPALVRRLGPAYAAMLAAGAGALRWTVLGATTRILPVALVEPLHGLTFALFHLAAMRLIGSIVPNHLAATAQAFYGTLAVGASTAILTLASGTLYERLGGSAFWAMALLCVAAIPVTHGMAMSIQPATPAR